LEDLVRQQASASSSRVGHSRETSDDIKSDSRRSDRSIDMKGLEQAMRGLGLRTGGKNRVQGRGRGRNSSYSQYEPPPGLVKEYDDGGPEVASSGVGVQEKQAKEVGCSQNAQSRLSQGSEKNNETSAVEAPKTDDIDGKNSCTEGNVEDKRDDGSNT